MTQPILNSGVSIVEVIVNSAKEVMIDGTAVGNVADAFLNFRDAAGAIYDGLIAYEQGLRDQIASLKTNLADAQTASAEAEAAVQKAAGDAETAIATAKSEAATEIQAAEAKAAATVETARAALQGQLDEKFAEANAAIAAAQTDAQKANSDCAFAQKLQQLHWQQTQFLMASQTESAVAVYREIQKMELIEDAGRLAARKAALSS